MVVAADPRIPPLLTIQEIPRLIEDANDDTQDSSPFHPSTVWQVAEIVDADARRELYANGKGRRQYIFFGRLVIQLPDRSWKTMIMQTARIHEAFGSPAPGEAITLDSTLVENVGRTVHEAVLPTLESFGIKLELSRYQSPTRATGFFGCSTEVQSKMARDLLSAYGCTYVLGNLKK